MQYQRGVNKLIINSKKKGVASLLVTRGRKNVLATTSFEPPPGPPSLQSIYCSLLLYTLHVMRSGERERDGRKVKIETRMEPELRDERVESSSGGDGEGRRGVSAHFAIQGKEGRRRGKSRGGRESLPPPLSDGPSPTAPRDKTMGGGHRAVCGLRVERGSKDFGRALSRHVLRPSTFAIRPTRLPRPPPPSSLLGLLGGSTRSSDTTSILLSPPAQQQPYPFAIPPLSRVRVLPLRQEQLPLPLAPPPSNHGLSECPLSFFLLSRASAASRVDPIREVEFMTTLVVSHSTHTHLLTFWGG